MNVEDIIPCRSKNFSFFSEKLSASSSALACGSILFSHLHLVSRYFVARFVLIADLRWQNSNRIACLIKKLWSAQRSKLYMLYHVKDVAYMKHKFKERQHVLVCCTPNPMFT